MLVGTEDGTTPVSAGEAGFLEIDVARAEYAPGQTSGSSSLGVAKFSYPDFSIDSDVVSIKGKLTASDNLSDLTNIATARVNLNVYSQSQVDAAIAASGGVSESQSIAYSIIFG